MSDIEFVNGLIVKAPSEKAPDFVKANISIKREDLIKWLSEKEGDWINVDVKVSKGGKWYAAVNDWKKGESPAQPTDAPEPAGPDVGDGDNNIPF